MPSAAKKFYSNKEFSIIIYKYIIKKFCLLTNNYLLKYYKTKNIIIFHVFIKSKLIISNNLITVNRIT